MNYNFGYNYLWKDIMRFSVHYEYLYNALYTKASSATIFAITHSSNKFITW